MEKIKENEFSRTGEVKIIGYRLVVRIPNEKHSWAEEYNGEEYDEVVKRYEGLKFDARDLLMRIEEVKSNEGDLVLDPCIGSGTTARAAILEKRKYIGFELNENNFKIALETLQ